MRDFPEDLFYPTITFHFPMEAITHSYEFSFAKSMLANDRCSSTDSDGKIPIVLKAETAGEDDIIRTTFYRNVITVDERYVRVAVIIALSRERSPFC